MASYVLKNTDKEYVFKIINENTFTVTLADTAKGGVTPDALTIRRWFVTMNAGNDYLEISRNSTPVIELHGNEVVDLSALGMTLSEESDQSVVIAPSNSGHKYTLIMALGKVID